MALWQAQTGQVQGLETVHVDLRDSWKANTATGVIHFISSKRLACGKHVARIWDTRNAYKISKRNLENNRLLGSPWYTSRQQRDSLSSDISWEWIYLYEVWCCGDCNGSYHGLPGCDSLQSGRRVSLLQRNKLHPSWGYNLCNSGIHVAANGVPLSHVLICRRRGTVSV